MKQLIIILVTFFLSTILLAQENSLKEKALEEFKKEHYNKAIGLLEKALQTEKDDAEIYYYLGFFNHYRAYDSRPLAGYDFSYSEKIFKYLDKAIELNPNYGDAKYFYGAECGVNAFRAMQNYDLKQLKHFYRLAYDKGAFPAWLMEFGKNMLNTCDKNAILFTGGDADFNVCFYLQLHENFRTDITIIPIGMIDRPWYVEFLKKGLKNGVKKINLNLTDKQICNIHPYKWKAAKVEIPVSASLLNKYKLENNYKMFWTVNPDLTSLRMHSKINGEKEKRREYLSPQRAILLQIVEDNFESRPIHFANTVNPVFLSELNIYFQNCGMVSRLTPLKTKQTEFEYDYEKIKNTLNEKNFTNYPTIKSNNIPRISNMVFVYHKCVYLLADYYKKTNDKNKLRELKNFYIKNLNIGFNKNFEKRLAEIFK